MKPRINGGGNHEVLPGHARAGIEGRPCRIPGEAAADELCQVND